MKRNDIIKKLIKEGFSEKTLAILPDNQINILAKKILNENEDKKVFIPKEKTDDIKKAELDRKTFETYENEEKKKDDEDIVENKKETKEAARTYAMQNRKNMPQGTKYQSGRKNKNKFKQTGDPYVENVTNELSGKPKKSKRKVDKKTKLLKTYKNLKETKEVKNWINNLINERYLPMATKETSNDS